MARQGKCDKCEIRWIWPGTLGLKKVRCPYCQEKLTETNYNSGMKTRTLPMVVPIGTTFNDNRGWLTDAFTFIEDRI